MNYELGPINKIILVGGGKLLLSLAVWARDFGFDVKVITAPRHASEVMGSSKVSLLDALKDARISVTVTDDIEAVEVREAVGDLKNNLSISFGAAWIFNQKTINSIFGGKLFNLHGTRLPQNRGGGGFSWQIMMGNRFGFCLIHKIDGGIDTGEIISHKEFIYPPSCRIPSDFYRFYHDQNFSFVVDFLKSIQKKKSKFQLLAQPEYLSTYWPRLHTPTHGWIDWSWSAAEIERFICAFDDPYPGSRTMLFGKVVVIKSAFASYQDGLFHPAQAGLVYRINQNWICVACRDGTIVIEKLADESGNILLGTIKNGDLFVTPLDRLQRNMDRIVYTPNDAMPKFRGG